MTKVTMNLSETDVLNTSKLMKKLDCRSKAATVGEALSVASIIVDIIKSGNEILVRKPDGSIDKLVITGI